MNEFLRQNKKITSIRQWATYLHQHAAFGFINSTYGANGVLESDPAQSGRLQESSSDVPT
jgi:hypothetical protein